MPSKVSRIPCVCQECGASFEILPHRLKEGRGKFCSKPCVQSFHTRNGTFACSPGFNTTPRHAVECHCGCGTTFEIPDHRLKSSKYKHFFVDRSHQLAFANHRRELNWLRGSGCYGSDWKRIAAAIRERDKVCQHCGKGPSAKQALDVHHINPYRVSLDNAPANLITLCRDCHLRITHTEVIPTTARPVRSYERICSYCQHPFTTPSPYRRRCNAECDRGMKREYERRCDERAKSEGRASYFNNLATAQQWAKDNKGKRNARTRKAYHEKRIIETAKPAPVPETLTCAECQTPFPRRTNRRDEQYCSPLCASRFCSRRYRRGKAAVSDV